ncbi:hypothetical protein ACHAWF_002464 [Thalassiosira exigua]
MVAKDDKEFLTSSHRAKYGDTSYEKSICLLEGEYVFSIYDDYATGLCCDSGEGSCSVTSYGLLIKEGGRFGNLEVEMFTFAFISAL